MTEERELTRRELAERLAQTEAELAKAKEQRGDAALAAELARTKAELARLKPESPPVSGQSVKLVPYKGLVKAKEDCYIGQFYKKGETFHVDADALWTDDPYEPVIVTGYTEEQRPITEKNPQAPEPIDFRFRPRSHDILADPGIRRAAEY